MHVAKAVALDFYDGAVGGFVELVDDGGNYCSWFRYELFSWNSGQNSRVLGLAAAETVGELLAEASDAQWPFWFPLRPSSITDHLEQLRTGDFVAIILSDGYFRRVEGFRSITTEMGQNIPDELPNYEADHFEFWRSQFLG